MNEQFGEAANDLLKSAVKYFQNDDRSMCERICRSLLRYPQLSDLHKAGCHYLLAHGTMDYVWHAEKALNLYEHLYEVRPGSSFSGAYEPTEPERARQAVRIGQAQRLLARVKTKAKKGEEKYRREMEEFVEFYGRAPTDEELVEADMADEREDIDSYFGRVDEAMVARVEAAENELGEEQSDVEAELEIDTDDEQFWHFKATSTSAAEPASPGDPAKSSLGYSKSYPGLVDEPANEAIEPPPTSLQFDLNAPPATPPHTEESS